MKVIFENENGRIIDLGMRGEYPWSSKVGRRLEMGDRQEEVWFATEINARSILRVDQKVEDWKKELMGKSAQTATA